MPSKWNVVLISDRKGKVLNGASSINWSLLESVCAVAAWTSYLLLMPIRNQSWLLLGLLMPSFARCKVLFENAAEAVLVKRYGTKFSTDRFSQTVRKFEKCLASAFTSGGGETATNASEKRALLISVQRGLGDYTCLPYAWVWRLILVHKHNWLTSQRNLTKYCSKTLKLATVSIGAMESGFFDCCLTQMKICTVSATYCSSSVLGGPAIKLMKICVRCRYQTLNDII